MTRCAKFHHLFDEVGDFCGMSRSAISQYKAYREQVKKLVNLGIDEDFVFENFPEGPGRILSGIKDDGIRTKTLNYVAGCLTRKEKVTEGDLRATLKGWSKEDQKSSVLNARSEMFTNVKSSSPKAEVRPETPDEKPQESAAPPAIKPDIVTSQVIKPEHGIILTEAFCRAKKCEHLKPCKERGNRIECFPAGVEPRHMNECPIAKRERLAQEGGFVPAASMPSDGIDDPITGGKIVKLAPVKITKAPMEILFKPSPKQQEFIETALKSGKFDTSEQVLSQALDLWMDQEGV